MKNDAFSDNFPNKFFFTHAIQSGFLPLWNPYLNFGFPVYADPGFAFWNPITWFFGGVIGYNAFTLTLEVLLYIYLAGVTMYRLGKYFNFSCTTSITIAAMYMCSGFFTGELQHINFLTSAAFLPFLVQKFVALSRYPCYKNASFAAIAYYLVFCGGHPAIPLVTVYFLITLTLLFFVYDKNIRQNWKQFLSYHAISIFIFILLFSPAIYSYLSIIGDYGRGLPANQFDRGAMQSGFSFSSYLSFFYPFATTRNTPFLTDDLAMRNCYFSIGGLILVLTQVKSKSPLVRSLMISAIIMFVFSSGGYIKTILFTHLPFLNYIRTNGEFRIISIMCLCVIAGFALDKYQVAEKESFISFKRILKIILVLSAAVLCVVVIKDRFHFLSLSGINIKSPGTGLKNLIDSLTFSNALLISVLLNLVIIIILLITKPAVRKLSVFIIIDLVINSIIYLPFAGVGTVTLAQIQQIYDKSGKGISIPPLLSIKNIDTLSPAMTGLVGSLSFYNKSIGITRMQDYPSYFLSTEAYFNSSYPAIINNVPFAFFKQDVDSFSNNASPANRLTIQSFSPENIRMDVDLIKDDSLIFLQNYFQFWSVKVDGHSAHIQKAFITFMSVPLSSGRHSIEFYYADKLLFIFIALSMATFIILLTTIYGGKTKKKEQNLLLNKQML